MTIAAIIPGIQPHAVRRNTIRNEPQPLSTTAKGGKITARIALISDIVSYIFNRLLISLQI